MKLILISLLFFTCSFSNAQELHVDSLWGVWNDQSQADTSRLKAIAGIGWELLFILPDSAIAISHLHYDFAKMVDNKKGMSAALNLKALAYQNMGEFEKSMKYQNECLKIQKDIGHQLGIAASFNNISNTYAELGNMTQAVIYAQKALSIRKKHGDKKGEGRSYNNIGLIYNEQGNFEKAHNYYQKALKLKREVNDQSGIASTYNNLGNNYFEQKNWQKAMAYYQKSYDLFSSLKHDHGKANSLGNMGTVYREQGDLEKAIDLFLASDSIQIKTGDKRGRVLSLGWIGDIYFHKGNYGKALHYVEMAEAIAQKMGVLHSLFEVQEYLYEIHKALGNDKQALLIKEQQMNIKDSLFAMDGKQASVRFEIELAYGLKEQADSIQNQNDKNIINVKHELELDQEENKRLALYGGLFLLLVFSWIMYNRYRLIRKQSTIIEKQKDKNLFLSQKILEQDQQLILGETAKTVAHELNSPLGVIKAGAEGINYLLDEFINELLPKCTKEEQAFASRLSKIQNTDEHIGNRQKKEKSNEMTHWIKEKFDVEQELCDELAHELSELHVFKPDEEIITFLIGSQNRQAMYKMARCMGQLRSISDHTITATNKSADVVSSVREALDFQESTETIDINLKDSISSVITIIESNIKEKGSCSMEINPDITLRSVNEFKNFQLWYNSLILIVEASKKPMELVVSSNVEEKKIQLIISIDQDISIMNIDEHHYKIIMEAKKNSSELRLGIVKYLLSENQINLKVDKSSEQTSFVFDFPVQNA